MKKPKIELTAKDGLLMGWCLAHNSSLTNLEQEGSAEQLEYAIDLTELLTWLEWRKIGDIDSISYAHYKAGVMEAIKNKLENTARLSLQKTSLDIYTAIKLNAEWVRLIEAFSLVTPEEAAEIANLSGTETRYAPKKLYQPNIKPTWIKPEQPAS